MTAPESKTHLERSYMLLAQVCCIPAIPQPVLKVHSVSYGSFFQMDMGMKLFRLQNGSWLFPLSKWKGEGWEERDRRENSSPSLYSWSFLASDMIEILPHLNKTSERQ